MLTASICGVGCVCVPRDYAYLGVRLSMCVSVTETVTVTDAVTVNVKVLLLVSLLLFHLSDTSRLISVLLSE